jgi:hypothetical protein
MGSDSRVGKDGEGIAFGPDAIEIVRRERIRETSVRRVAEELAAARRHPSAGERSRTGYRHGTRERTLPRSLGPTTCAMPRARVVAGEGQRQDWRSHIVPRSERRTLTLRIEPVVP